MARPAAVWRYSRGLFECAYCAIAPEEAWIATEQAVAVPHPEPVATCHIIVAPRRHVPTVFALDAGEQRGLWEIVTEIRTRICRSMRIQGFHLGFADAPEGCSHACVHIVPRLAGEERLALPPGLQWVDAGGQS